MMYVQDYDEVMIPYTTSPPGTTYTWPKLLEPYINNLAVFDCPSSGRKFNGTSSYSVGYGGNVFAMTYPPSAWMYSMVLGTQSVASMVTVPDSGLVCVGTTWRGGSASEAPVTAPRLLLWDFDSREMVFEIVPVEGEDSIVQMIMLDGLIYATTSGSGYLVVFDPYEREIVHCAPLGHGSGVLFGLRHNPADGMLYAISGDSLLRIVPGSYETELLGTWPGLDWGLGIAADRIYVYSGTDLIRFSIPPTQEGAR